MSAMLTLTWIILRIQPLFKLVQPKSKNWVQVPSLESLLNIQLKKDCKSSPPSELSNEHNYDLLATRMPWVFVVDSGCWVSFRSSCPLILILCFARNSLTSFPLLTSFELRLSITFVNCKRKSLFSKMCKKKIISGISTSITIYTDMSLRIRGQRFNTATADLSLAFV